MKKPLVNKTKMFMSVSGECEKNPDVVAKIPQGKESVADLNDAIAQIGDNQAKYDREDTSGLTEEKKQKRKALEAGTESNRSKLHAYAVHVKDPVLTAATDLKLRDLTSVSEVSLQNTSEGIYQLINTHLPHLATYLLSADTQKAYRALIDDFVATIPARQQHQALLDSFSNLIAAGIDKGDDALMNLDEGVEVIKELYPEFYAAYNTVRQIPKYGKVTLQMQGKVADADGNPIAGVTIGIYKKEAPEVAVLTKKTAAMGGFNVKTLAEGYYIVKAQKTGFVDYETTVAVVFEALCRVDIVMTKATIS